MAPIKKKANTVPKNTGIPGFCKNIVPYCTGMKFLIPLEPGGGRTLARGLSLVSAELAVQNSVSRPVDFATLQSYKLTTLQPYILTILQHYNLTTLQSFNQKLMKTPSNPQFSPIGPGNCREKTLITTKFLNPKVCFGVPD